MAVMGNSKNYNTETHLTFFGNLSATFEYSTIEQEFYKDKYKGKNIENLLCNKINTTLQNRVALDSADPSSGPAILQVCKSCRYCYKDKELKKLQRFQSMYCNKSEKCKDNPHWDDAIENGFSEKKEGQRRFSDIKKRKDFISMLISLQVREYNEKVCKARYPEGENKKNLYGINFEYQPIKNSIIDRKQFADNYLNDVIYAHFHCGEGKRFKALFYRHLLSKIKKHMKTSKFEGKKNPFVLLDKALGDENDLSCFAPIEITIFRNGMFSVIFHLGSNVVDQPEKKSREVSYENYLEYIKRPDYLIEDHDEYGNDITPGLLIEAVAREFALEIVPQIIDFLNHLQLKTRSWGESNKKYNILPREYIYIPSLFPEDSSLSIETLSELNRKYNYWEGEKRIYIFRPYLSTYHVVPPNSEPGHTNKMKRFAIAAARAIPEIYADEKFDTSRYLRHGQPVKQDYIPRNEIIYLSQRGWSVVRFKREPPPEISNKAPGANRIFRTEIIETITIGIHIVVSASISARNLQREINNKGRSKMVAMLDFGEKSAFKRFLLCHEKYGIIRDFTRFLHRMRIHATSHDLFLNIPAYIKGNTARATIERLIEIVNLTTTVQKTKDTLTSYQAFLEKFNQQAQQSNLVMVAVSLIVMVVIGLVQIVLEVLQDKPTACIKWVSGFLG